MPLLLLIVGLVLTVTGAVRLSPFWAETGAVSPVVGYGLLLTGLMALTMVVPWMIVRLLMDLQTVLTDELPPQER